MATETQKMQDFPKFVRGRLAAVKAQANADAHPDADRLTAFAEQMLSVQERSTVLDHLAACADCREIVALALPEVDALQPVLRAKRSGWLAWPAMRWALVAAGVVAISSVGVMQYQRHERAAVSLQKFAPMTAALTESKNLAQTTTAPAEASATKNQNAVQTVQPAAGLRTRVSNVETPRQSDSTQAYAERSHSDSANMTATLNGPSPAAPVPTRVPPPMAKKVFTENLVAEASVSAIPGADKEIRVDRAKPATPPAAALWKVADNGVLLRSLDSGQSWQNVNVGPGFVPAGATFEGSVKNALAKATDSNSPTSFAVRAVSANGSDVWAGGSAGLLYHSTDNGASWIRVLPISAGARLTGDIATIDFSDPMHGKISTSTGETWITTDDGQTWQRP